MMGKKRKIAVMLALMLSGLCGTAHAQVYTETISGAKDTGYGSDIKTGNVNSGEYTYTFQEGDSLEVSNTKGGIVITGTNTYKGAKKITVSSPLDIKVTLKDNTGYGSQMVAGLILDTTEDSAEIDRSIGGNITVSSDGGQDNELIAGAAVRKGSSDGKDRVIQVGDGDITVTSMNAKGKTDAYGLYASYTGQITMGEGNITVKTENAGGDSTSIGASAENGGVITIEKATIDASADNAGGSYTAYGLKVSNGGTINMAGGSITAGGSGTGRDAIYAVHNSGGTINLNQGTANDLVVNGDIMSTGDQSVTNLNLNTANSSFTGWSICSSGKVNVSLANGAVWNNRPGYSGNSGSAMYSKVTSLSMDGGIFNQKSDKAITIENYSGMGNIFFTAKDEDKEGVLDLTGTGDVKIGKAEEGSFIQVGVTNQTVNTLDIQKTEESLNALAGKVKYTAGDGQLGGEVILAEGLITPEARADLVFGTDGKGYAANITGGDRAVTQTMQAMRGIAAVNIVSWRQEDSTLSQRLGDLRETTGGQGIWARVSRGEFEYGGAFKNQYNYFQIGWDMAKDDWHYGAAVSYNDGETTYANGNGENSSTSLSLYGTRLLNDGQYFDIVLKAGRLNNKYDNYAAAGHTHGDYDAWGTEISGEYGKKIDLSNDWFVTPQAQLSLMRIGSEEYTTSNGIHVDQDTLYSAVGRIGAEAGKKTAWGSLYAKASILHDFAGDADTYLTYQGLSNSYSQDIGDTWYEAGFGANWKMSESSYLYVDVIRTFGGDIKTPWQWNAGVRWGF